MGLILRNSGGFVRLRGYNSQLSSQGFYLTGLPSFTIDKYSLAFNAEPAEVLGDYEAGTLYFRDSNFNRVAATFSRTSSATRVNKQGLIETVATGIPRIDYTDGSAKLLMEPARTNLVTYSNDFTDPSWTVVSTTIVPNYGISPDGTINSSRFTFTTASSYVQVGAFANATYSTTIYVKGTSGETIRFGTGINIGGGQIFTLNGSWQKLTHTGTGNRIFISNLGATATQIEVYGAQIEAASYPTSYIPTAGSAVTRNADDLFADNISTFISTEGTMFLDFIASPSAGTQSFTISDGSVANYIYMRYVSNGQTQVGIQVSSSLVVVIVGPTLTIGQRYKMAFGYKGGDSAFYVNGVAAATTSYATMPSGLNRLDFDLYTTTANTFISPVNDSILFPTRLTNSELAQLTS